MVVTNICHIFDYNLKNNKMKKSEEKYESPKQLLSVNRNFVIKSLNTEFSFDKIEIKELMRDYFNFVINSRYNLIFTTIIEKKDLNKLISNSISFFKKQYKTLEKDWDAINDFTEERQKISRGSISI